MRIAYADPPYPGQSKRLYGDHPDYDGEVDHADLAKDLLEFDGWILHTSSPALFWVQQCLYETGETPMYWDRRGGTYRVGAWVKPFCAFKKNVPVAYAWEPVLIKACRKPVVNHLLTSRDFISENITMQRGLAGAKPEKVCRWAFQVAGMQPDDELVDLYPGSGAVTDAWVRWRADLVLAEPEDERQIEHYERVRLGEFGGLGDDETPHWINPETSTPYPGVDQHEETP